MKTDPPENDCYNNKAKPATLSENHSKTIGTSTGTNDYQSCSESDNLITCKPELVASLRTGVGLLKNEKHKLSPGHYLQKVLLSSVAQKFKSQSLPNCFEKKKYSKSTISTAIEEVNETSVPLVTEERPTVPGNLPNEDAPSEAWFKTWPERSVDKVFLETLEGSVSSIKTTTTKTGINEGTSYIEKILIKSSLHDESADGQFLLVGSRSSCGEGEIISNYDEKCESHSLNQCDVSRVNKLKLIEKNHGFQNESPTKNLINHVNGSSKSIQLDDLLDSFPLAYSPVTKQLVLVAAHKEDISNLAVGCNDFGLVPSENLICSEGCVNKSTLEERESDKLVGAKSWPVNTGTSETELKQERSIHQVSTDVGLSSFSSTVSSLSDNSPSTNEDSALGSLLDHGDNCSLVSVEGCSAFSEDSLGNKPKKKSLSGFFSKSVFNWKSASRSEDSIVGSGVSWKIFGKNSSPQSSISSLTVDHNNEHSDEWSLAPDSPSSVRSGSGSGTGTTKERSFTHENRVASSSALIQLDRPANLPAKSEEEEARHRQEYQQIVEAARKKELKEAKHRKKQLQMQLRAEEQLAQATRIWTCEILPRWDQTYTSKKTRELWWQGVPPCVRGRVWKLAIGNHLNLTHSLYDICVERAQDRLRSGGASSEDEDSDNKEASMQLIQLDISRTFPHLCIFQKGGPYYDMLHCLLAAYVCYRPDVGYVQGMSFIAAVLILNMDAPDAFVCFANLLNRPCHMAFFHLNQPLMQAYYSTYNELFKENLPQLYAHFCSTTLTPDLYLLDWIYTVFTKAMSLDLASRIWDVFLRDGEQFLFRTALGVLHLSQDSLQQMDFVHGSQFLTRLPDDLSGDLLFKSISCIKMSVGKQTFEDILATHSVDCH